MSYSSYYTPEPEVYDLPANLFCDSYDIPGVYEDCPPLLAAVYGPCPLTNSASSLQEDFFPYYIPSPYRQEEVYPAASSYNGEELPYNNWESWENVYDSCFSFSGGWGDEYISTGNGAADDGYGLDTGTSKDEYSVQREEEYRDNYVSYYENAERQLGCAGSPWYGCESWLGYASEEDNRFFSRQQARHAYSSSPDEMGLCEALFGYWPCLMEKHRNASAH